ncbi:MAG: PAS domain S-box protein [Candidatus Methanoperedens sp.]
MNSLEINQKIAELEKLENEHKLTIEILQASENKYKELLENLPQKIFHKDKNSVYVSCNNNYARDLKIQPDEIIGKTDYDFYTKELAEKYRADDIRIMESGKTEYIEEKYIQNGQEVFVQTAKTPLKDEKGNTIGILGIFWDITERKQTDEALKESEERYRTIIEYSNDMIWTLDTEGRFLFFNNRSEEITGFKLEDWRGKSFAPLIKKEELPKIIEVFHKTLSGKPQQYEVTVKKADGSKLILLVNTAPIYSKGKVVGTVSFGRDITERKETEEQIKESLRQELEKSYENLRDSEARYRDLFENANDAIFTSDAEGYIITANNATVRNLGCKTKDEVIGTHFSDWLTPESIQNAQNNKRKYLSGELVKQPVVHEFIWKNGEHRWAEIISRIIKEGDKAIALHCIARDITEKRKLEQELKESETKYRDLFENAQDAMYVIDTKGNFLKMNQIGLQTLGYTREEVIGSNISKFITSESFKIIKERQKKRHVGKIVNQTNVLEIVCKNGEHRWVEIKTRDIKGEDKIIEIHGIARDITENIILKQKLKKSDKQRKLLCHLIEGTRGGKTRALILKHLTEKSINAHQLAKALNMDYKTIRHHLKVLEKKGIITRGQDEYSGLYFISRNIESDLNEMDI